MVSLAVQGRPAKAGRTGMFCHPGTADSHRPSQGASRSSLGPRAPWGRGWRRTERGGGYTPPGPAQPLPPQTFPRTPVADGASEWAMGEARDSRQAARPAPLSPHPAPGPGEQPGTAAWSQPRVQAKTKQKERAVNTVWGRVRASWGEPCSWPGGGSSPPAMRPVPHPPNRLFVPLHRQNMTGVAGRMECSRSREPAGRWSGAGCPPPVLALPPTPGQ